MEELFGLLFQRAKRSFTRGLHPAPLQGAKIRLLCLAAACLLQGFHSAAGQATATSGQSKVINLSCKGDAFAGGEGRVAVNVQERTLFFEHYLYHRGEEDGCLGKMTVTDDSYTASRGCGSWNQVIYIDRVTGHLIYDFYQNINHETNRTTRTAECEVIDPKTKF